MPEENVEAFRAYLNAHSGLTDEDLVEVMHIDVPMPMSYVTPELVRQLSLLEPFGNGNPKPVNHCKAHLWSLRLQLSAILRSPASPSAGTRLPGTH